MLYYSQAWLREDTGSQLPVKCEQVFNQAGAPLGCLLLTRSVKCKAVTTTAPAGSAYLIARGAA